MNAKVTMNIKDTSEKVTKFVNKQVVTNRNYIICQC